MSCESRGYHRIPAMELECLECGAVLTPAETLANEGRKMKRMEAMAAERKPTCRHGMEVGLGCMLCISEAMAGFRKSR